MKLIPSKCSRILCSAAGLAALFISLTAPVWAAEGTAAAPAADTNYTGELWAALPAAPVLQAAAEITPHQYPDSDAATVEHKMLRVYHADGTAECQDESYEKVLTEKGRRDSRMISLEFTLPYSTVSVPRLEIFKADGSVQVVDVAANSKETINDSQMGMNIYDPNDKVLQVNIPQLDVGDVIHAITRETVRRSRIPGQYADLNVFEDTGYIRHTSYEVHAPAERPLIRQALRDPVPGTVTSTVATNADGTIVYHWEVKDVPRMFGEPEMPPADAVLQRVLVSTLPDWPAVSKWYWDLSQPHLEASSPEMLAEMAKLTNGAASDLDKVKAIFYYVSKKVRYMGVTPEQDRPGYEPHDVKLTFANKYGVCRDKAALLVALLRAAGLPAYPVLINIGAKRDQEVPNFFFDHAIAAWETRPGQYTLMDPTDENTRDLLPYYDCNRSFLVCRAAGENLLVSPVHPPEEHMMRVTTTGTLSVAGELEAQSVLSFEGVNDDAYRNAFVSMKPDMRRRFFESNLKQSLPGARLESLELTPTNMLDMAQNVRAVVKFRATGLTATGNGLGIVSLPWVGGRLGMVNFILNGTGLEKRKYPLDTATTCGLEESLDLQLGPGFGSAVSLPTCTPDEDANLGWREECACAEGRLTGRRTLKLKTIEFSPSAYLKLKSALQTMEYDGRKSPVLALTVKPKTGSALQSSGGPEHVASDAKLLNSEKTVTLTDAHSGVTHVKYAKQILSYNGKKREAELKLDYNPATQSAKLIRAVVTARDGTRQEISATEQHLMDQGWNASAKRYTGGKILVANLPGVDIGSTIEAEFEVTWHDRPFTAGSDPFQFSDELGAKTLTVSVPDGVPFTERVTGPAGVVTEQKQHGSGRTTWTWRAQNVAALPAEPGVPPAWLWAAGVHFLAGDSAAYYRELNATLLARSALGTNASAMARHLAVEAKTRRETVVAIRDFVAKSIRPAGPSFSDLPLSELSAADTTLADGYGHGADRAILLHAMLTAAGFQPEFVLASGLPDLQEVKRFLKTYPVPGDFQEVLVRVRVDGRTCYLNDSDQYAELGTTGADGRWAIRLADGKREVLAAAKGDETRSETDYQAGFTADGRVKVRVVTRYYGEEYNSWHRYFAELPPEERRRYFQELVSGFSQGARAAGDLVTRFDTYPGVQEYTVEADHYGVVDGRYFYFDLPFSPSLFAAGADRRTLPLYQAGRSHDVIQAEVALPPGFEKVVIAPPTETLSAHGGVARIQAGKSGGQYRLTETMDREAAVVSPADYQEQLRVEAALRERSSRVFLLEKP